VTSQTVSPMSYRSSSMSVRVSPYNLAALVSFCGPVCSVPHNHFNCVEVVLGSVPSTVSSVPCPVVKSSPFSSYVVVALAVTVFRWPWSVLRRPLLPHEKPLPPRLTVHSTSVVSAAWWHPFVFVLLPHRTLPGSGYIIRVSMSRGPRKQHHQLIWMRVWSISAPDPSVPWYTHCAYPP